MVGTFVARVAFRNHKNCFISVPQHFLPPNLSNQIVAFQLDVADGHTSSYFSWSGEVTSSPSARNAVSTDSLVEINGLYAFKLGLHEGQEILVTQVPNVAHLEIVNVEPVAVEDWEILELHANYVQNNLLNQVRIVWNGQILPVWVEHNVCIFIRISNLMPEGLVGRLEQMTEVHVSPKTRNIANSESSRASHSTSDSRGSYRKNQFNVGEYVQKSSVEETSSEALTSTASKGWWPAVRGSVLKDFADRWIFGIDHHHHHHHHSSICEEKLLEDFSEQHLRENVKFEVELRVHSSERLQELLSECPNGGPYDSRRLCIQPYTAFVVSSSLPVEVGRPLAIARLSRVVPLYEISEKSTLKTSPVESASTNKSIKTPSASLQESKRPAKEVKRMSCYVKVVIIDALLNHLDGHWKNFNLVASRITDLMVPGVVYVPTSVKQHLGCEATSRATLRFGTTTFRRPDSLKLASVKKMIPDVSTACLHLEVSHWLASVCSTQCPIIATNGSVLQILTANVLEEHFVLKDESASVPHDEDSIDGDGKDEMALLVTPSMKVELEWDGVKNKRLPSLLHVPTVGLKSAAVGGMDDLIYRGLKFLSANLGLGPLSDHLKQSSKGSSGGGDGGGLLITGPRGSGKTTLAQTLCRELADTAYKVHCSYVACKSLKGKRVESVFRVWLRTFQEATYRAPSIVLLDDLDYLIGASNGPEHEVGVMANYHLRMSNALLQILKAVTVSRNARVVVVATCLVAASLHPTLTSSQGVHIFQDILEIKNPTMDQRSAILQRLILSKTIISSESLSNADNLRPILTRTEGFVAQDLNMLLDRAVHAASRKSSNDLDCELVLSVQDLETALVDYVPASLRDIRQEATSGPSKSWNDVGGLRAVKQALIQTLQWPAKYPEIFLRCPMPMRSGVLLYGPPGTGKTLLASVVAKECNMNFISIKGPELLSKYIGASEQSVRDLFQKAANAKPCIIFFDEFDSLASKRGHDSTGVTDRVVNQLLTQLDGVEGRDGIYILAATSRPDLIDSALLRPGRFDRCLCCPMPSQEERVEILQALTSSVSLASNVDLVEIAAFCDNFSGADLQGLLCNAQLKAIHRLTSSHGKLSPNSSFDEFCCVEDKDASIESSDNSETIFLPSLEEGISPLSDSATRDKVENQVDVILSNSCGWERRRRKMESTSSSSTTTTTCTTTTASTSLSNEDLIEALSDMKPSVNAKERQRYDAIYRRFTKSRGGDFTGTSQVPPTAIAVAQRATLA